MTGLAVAQILIFVALLTLLAVPLGYLSARILGESQSIQISFFAKFEERLFSLAGIRRQEMNWIDYIRAVMIFNLVGLLFLYLLQRIQGVLPLNPQGFSSLPSDLAFNTAVSFVTNTNWQAYGGERTMSYLTQMLGLTVQNFLSAATGLSVLLALIRGLTRKETKYIGSFWIDLWRSTIYVLLPLSIVTAILLVSQGVPQTVQVYEKINPLEQVVNVSQEGRVQHLIPLGPVASQVAIKQLGTNGGGFFNTNSAHPFENPTPITNLIELLAILLIPAALCHTFGAMVGDRRQGWALYISMLVIFLLFLLPTVHFESQPNLALKDLWIDQVSSNLQSGGNMEGKEVRIGITSSVIWAIATTAASNGSVNSMHDSFSALGGMFPMILMQLGEVVFGGVGSGLYGMLVFVMMTVFIAGLMIGRTPEYLGKKIGIYEVKLVALIILIPCALVLLGTAVGVLTESGRASVLNTGPHGFSELLYAYSSMANNNGSAFAGINADIPLHNILGAVVMFVARFWLIVPTLALAGSLAEKKKVPIGQGTLETHTMLFCAMLISVVLIVGALTFFPALALGPLVEHLKYSAGRL